MEVPIGAIVTLVIFIAGLIYHAGRQSARLDGVEKAVERYGAELTKRLDEIQAMVRAAISERRNWREENQ